MAIIGSLFYNEHAKLKTYMIQICLLCAVLLLVPGSTHAQGTMTYLSSLSTNSTGSVAVGSDSWMAALFRTGTNSGGYTLDSVQLGMLDASANPTNFTVMVYSAIVGGAVLPGSSLGTLEGSLSPVSGGFFTYTPAATITLSPGTRYFVVLTAGTTVAGGSYSWSESVFPPNSIDSWSAGNGVLQSGDGISGWHTTPYLGIAQFAIDATAIPEPDFLGLVGLGGLAFLWHRRRL